MSTPTLLSGQMKRTLWRFLGVALIVMAALFVDHGVMSSPASSGFSLGILVAIGGWLVRHGQLP